MFAMHSTSLRSLQNSQVLDMAVDCNEGGAALRCLLAAMTSKYFLTTASIADNNRNKVKAGNTIAVTQCQQCAFQDSAVSSSIRRQRTAGDSPPGKDSRLPPKGGAALRCLLRAITSSPLSLWIAPSLSDTQMTLPPRRWIISAAQAPTLPKPCVNAQQAIFQCWSKTGKTSG